MNREGATATYDAVEYGGNRTAVNSVQQPLRQDQASERHSNFNNIAHVKVELPSPSPATSLTSSPSPPTTLSLSLSQQSTHTHPPQLLTTTPLSLSQSSPFLTQMNSLGPTDRCTPSQAQAMGQQVLAVIALHEKSALRLPHELQNSFDVFHRCLAVVFGTFFLNLYTKANAPCLLCHGCKSLYPPGQFIHHTCPALPTTIVPCRSRMWRRCLVPLVSPGVDKLQQKQRWKFVLEKFSHNNHRRQNPIPATAEAQILEMPECKRGRFVAPPTSEQQQQLQQAQQQQQMQQDQEEEVLEREEEEEGGDEEEEEEGKEEREKEMVERAPPMAAGYPHNHSASNLLDIEPVEGDDDEEDCTLESLATMDSTSPPPPRSHNTPSASSSSHPHTITSTSALGLAEQLVIEVRRLQRELTVTKSKLTTAEELIHKMPSEACMREQLAQALAMQQQLSLEREQALEQARLARERADQLQLQLNRLRMAHGEMEKHFMELP